MRKTEHSIDWRKTAMEIEADYEAMAKELDDLRDLFKSVKRGEQEYREMWKACEELICAAAPMAWVLHDDMAGAYEWEKKAELILKGTTKETPCTNQI